MGWQPGAGEGPDDESSGPGSGLPGGPGIPQPPGGSPGGVPGGVPGGAPGEPRRDGRLAGFARGGRWDSCPPSAGLAVVLEGVSGRGWRCPGAGRDELFGVLRRWAALESWAAAGKLGLLRALMREEDLPLPGGGRHGDLPGGWSQSLAHEVSAALAMPPQSADKLMWLARDLAAVLPGIGGLLADGTLTQAKARAVSEALEFLSEQDMARAEAMIVPSLAGKTYGQVEKLAVQAAVTVDPGSAARRRQDAERNRAKVSLRRGPSGAASLSGYDLPTDETLAAHAQVCARAAHYQASGAFPGVRMDQFRAQAYLDILNGITAAARIAAGQPETGLGAPGEHAPAGPDAPAEDAGPGEPGTANDEDGEAENEETADEEARDAGGGPADDERPDDGPPDGGPPDDGPADDGPAGGGPAGGGPAGGGPCGPAGGPADRGGPGPGPGSSPGPGSEREREPGPGPGPAPGPGPGPAPAAGSPSPSPAVPRLADLVVPLATLLGLAWRPGEGHGLGPLDPGLCRALAAAAVGSPHSTLCVTVTDEHGHAIGHGCARSARPARTSQPPGRTANGPPGVLAALPARMNLTITSTLLAELATRPQGGRSGSWSLTRSSDHGPPGGYGTWELTLPDGTIRTAVLEPVPTFGCDHARESHAYQPSRALRHLVQVRDYECTFPTCSRHARESDFEHAVPYHKGGRTCGCNAGARSRQCHRVKQSPGWTVTQPRPGWHHWETPSGRVYLQEPKRYPV